MDAKTILIGIVIGLLIGIGMGYVAAPSPDITSYESQISGLNNQITTLNTQTSAHYTIVP